MTARKPAARKESTPPAAPPPSALPTPPVPSDLQYLADLVVRDGVAASDHLLLFALLVELRAIRVLLSTREAPRGESG